MGPAGTYVGNGDGLGSLAAQILEQVLDEDRALGDLAVDLDGRVVGCGEVNELRLIGSAGHYDGGLVYGFG